MSVYLDFNSSAPIDYRVLDVMIDIYKNSTGNADSRTHNFGEVARQVVEKARSQVASILSISKDEIFFTSGATESNNIAIQGLRGYAKETGKQHIIVSSIEHKAVLETAKALREEGFDVEFVNPDLSGRVSAEVIKSLVRKDTLLVSIMHVNNETGIIQPVEEIGEFLVKKDAFFHVDATQSFGKLIDELRSVKYDMLSMSAHKVSGPQGVGALVLRKNGYRLPPVKGIMHGGQQEHSIRPGTIPVALVAGLGMACELAENEYDENYQKCSVVKARLIQLLDESGMSYELNGDQDYCVPSTINICFHGVASEALMLATKEYCGISNGSACNSNSYHPSFVLTAMGVPIEKIQNSVRVSWGPYSNVEEVEGAFRQMIEKAKGLAL